MIDITVLQKKRKRLEKEMDKKIKDYRRLRMELMDLNYMMRQIDEQIAIGVSSKAKKGQQP